MTPESISLIQASFARVLPDQDAVARAFYQRLFALDPSLRRMFADDMAEQRGKLMLTLATVVTELADLSRITPSVEALAVRHLRYGVVDRHYALVGDALLGALADALGPRFTPAHRTAWAEAYTVLADMMIAAARRAA